jgi:hypothetical protein
MTDQGSEKPTSDPQIRVAWIGAGGTIGAALLGVVAVLITAHNRLITDEGVAVGGAFDSDTATCMTPVAHRVAGELQFRRS